MSTCNPTHPNCLKLVPVSNVRFCAGCGRSAEDVAFETANENQDPVVVSDLDVVAEPDVVASSPSVASVALAVDGLNDQDDDVAFADSTDDAISVSVSISNPGAAASVSNAPTASPLPAVAPTAISLQTALAQLQEWTARWNCEDDPYVAGLSQAISQRDDLTMWASLSPLECLPRPTLQMGSGSTDLLIKLLTIFRNVLVFVPVAITWFAIGKASEAYGQFTLDNPGTELNFLQFWQAGEVGGEQYLSDFWKIGDVARFDALLIGVIVVLTLLVGAFSAQRERSEARFESSSEADRIRLSLVLANALHGRRSASPESIGESLAEALNDLTQAARDVNDGAARLERATTGVESLSPKLDILNQHTDRLVGQSIQSVTASMSALVSSVGQLNSAVSSNVTQVFTDASANLEEVSAQFARIAASMEIGVAQLRADLEYINRQLGTGSKGTR